LNGRVANGRIKNCHGDLHTQHICFIDGICIYDCIEFNDRFRYVDIAAEASFLAMDLDHWKRPDLSNKFVSAYAAHGGDMQMLKLVNFYKCYFAYVRGKVYGFKMDAPLVTEEDKEKDTSKTPNSILRLQRSI